MNLKSAQIQQFLTYLIEQKTLQGVIDDKNEDQLIFCLHDEWLKFTQ